jgi:Gluconate 2-dehydrogenase subunit 3
MAAAASSPWLGGPVIAAGAASPYGRDPKLNTSYKPGDLWPLTLSPAETVMVTALCDLIMPADDVSPAASAVGVPAFVDEWISAPYEVQRGHRKTVLGGLAWLDAESRRRFGKPFADAGAPSQTKIADDICYAPGAAPDLKPAAEFFDLFRNLVTTGYYTTREGMKDIGYRGNTPQTHYSGPPKEILERLGLA